MRSTLPEAPLRARLAAPCAAAAASGLATIRLAFAAGWLVARAGLGCLACLDGAGGVEQRLPGPPLLRPPLEAAPSEPPLAPAKGTIEVPR